MLNGAELAYDVAFILTNVGKVVDVFINYGERRQCDVSPNHMNEVEISVVFFCLLSLALQV